MVTVNISSASALYALFESKQLSTKMVPPINNTFIPEIEQAQGAALKI